MVVGKGRSRGSGKYWGGGGGGGLGVVVGRSSPALFLRMLSAALFSNVPALTSLTAACADLVQTFCANHGWVLQKASFSSSNKVLFLRIACPRLPLYSLSMVSLGSYRELLQDTENEHLQ